MSRSIDFAIPEGVKSIPSIDLVLWGNEGNGKVLFGEIELKYSFRMDAVSSYYRSFLLSSVNLGKFEFSQVARHCALLSALRAVPAHPGADAVPPESPVPGPARATGQRRTPGQCNAGRSQGAPGGGRKHTGRPRRLCTGAHRGLDGQSLLTLFLCL